ncbi:MAG TPA: alpha/beta fold hydrolase [Kutzneria sp.]|nr:alpha/beta fold hydrolase [Kutzneria sp.]
MSSVVIPQPVPDARMRVFLFHHAGGSHLLYRDWVPHFPADWEVCLVEAPGRGRLSHLDPLDDVADIVSFLLPDIRQLLDKPFILFGHSMGAMIAYELTHRLLTAGLPLPSWLGLSARAAPRPDGGLDVRNRHLMPADALRRSIADMGGTPWSVLSDPDWWAFLEPLLRADLKAVETWRPRPGTPVLPVPLSVFGGEHDVVVRPERLLAWQQRTEYFRGMHVFDGDHFYFKGRLPDFVDRIVADVGVFSVR